MNRLNHVMSNLNLFLTQRRRDAEAQGKQFSYQDDINKHLKFLFLPLVFLCASAPLRLCVKHACRLIVPLLYVVLSRVEATDFPDLEENYQDFVISTKQINIPGYPTAFNPSIIRWNGKLLLSFRVMPDRKTFDSDIGIVYLNHNFEVISQPQILNTNILNPSVTSKAEDARLICANGKLWMVYSNNKDEKITKGGFRVFISELVENKGVFNLGQTEVLTDYEGATPLLREKNWSPFIYANNLLLIYSASPHCIFRPLFTQGKCETFAKSYRTTDWKWGILRGGTPAELIGNEYLTFFHSSIKMTSIQSENKESLHYFMGAYTFSKEPPFELRSISPEPIIGKNFYNGKKYKPYWHPIQAVFPGGYIMNEKYIWVVYGRQDRESWVVKLDRSAFLDSLIPVKPE